MVSPALDAASPAFVAASAAFVAPSAARPAENAAFTASMMPPSCRLTFFFFENNGFFSFP